MSVNKLEDDILEYMLDTDVIIMAEYENINDLENQHLLNLINETIRVATKEKNKNIVDRLNQFKSSLIESENIKKEDLKSMDNKEVFEGVGYDELSNQLICEFDLGNLDRQEAQEKIYEILKESKILDETVTEDGYSYNSKYPDSRQSQLSSIISINYKEKNLYIVIINSDEIDNELFTICNTEKKAREVFDNNLAPVFNNFISKESFKDFLDNNLKTENYDFKAYLDDLETQYGNTGVKEYELKGNETKTGNPTYYDYEFIHKKSEERTAEELRDYLVDLEGTNEISYLGLAIAHSIVNQLENYEQKMTEKDLISVTESIAKSEEFNNFVDNRIYEHLEKRNIKTEIGEDLKDEEEEDQL